MSYENSLRAWESLSELAEGKKREGATHLPSPSAANTSSIWLLMTSSNSSHGFGNERSQKSWFGFWGFFTTVWLAKHQAESEKENLPVNEFSQKGAEQSCHISKKFSWWFEYLHVWFVCTTEIMDLIWTRFIRAQTRLLQSQKRLFFSENTLNQPQSTQYIQCVQRTHS